MNENGNNQSQNKLSCNIVRDLLPNYIEHVTSPRTNEEMEMHLRECRECKNTYLNLTKDLGIEKMEEQEEMEYVKDGLIKARRMYMLKGIAETVILLALLVPGVVNFAVNRHFTWYYIVLSSILYLMAIAGTAILKKKDKIISTFAVGTILTPFYLLAMEATINKYFLSQPVYWFRTIAFPVVCVWLVVIWMTLLLIRFTKMNNAYCIGIGFVLATMGSVLTNWVVLNERGKTLLASSWIGAFCCIVCAVMAFVIGGRLKKEGQK